MRALALLRVLVGPIVLLHLWPFLSDALDGRTYQRRLLRALRRLVSGAARSALHRTAHAGRGGRRGDVARRVHPGWPRRDLRDRDLQPVPVHHALPQQPGLPGDRPGSAGGGAERRELDRGRPGLAALAAPLRVRRDLRGVGAEQARRPRLVRRHGHLAAGRARPRRPGGVATAGLGGVAAHRPELSHRRRQADRAHRAVDRARSVVAPHPLRGRLGRRGLSRGHRAVGIGTGLLVPGHRCAGDLGGAVHPGPGAPH